MYFLFYIGIHIYMLMDDQTKTLKHIKFNIAVFQSNRIELIIISE